MGRVEELAEELGVDPESLRSALVGLIGLPPQNTLTLAGTFGPDPFDQFWSAYPLKRDKEAARRAFRRVLKERKATFQELMQGVSRYAAEDRGAYTKHPATWLNAGSWSNAPRPAASTRGGSALEGLASYIGTRNV